MSPYNQPNIPFLCVFHFEWDFQNCSIFYLWRISFLRMKCCNYMQLYVATMNPIVIHLGYEEKAFQFTPVCVQHLRQCPWMCWQGKWTINRNKKWHSNLAVWHDHSVTKVPPSSSDQTSIRQKIIFICKRMVQMFLCVFFCVKSNICQLPLRYSWIISGTGITQISSRNLWKLVKS